MTYSACHQRGTRKKLSSQQDWNLTINKDNDCMSMILTEVDNTYRTFRFPNVGNLGKNTI